MVPTEWGVYLVRLTEYTKVKQKTYVGINYRVEVEKRRDCTVFVKSYDP